MSISISRGSDSVSVSLVPDVILNKRCESVIRESPLNIVSLYPFQKICASLVISRLRNPGFSMYDCDLCVSAPTGQGKTLAYLLPIVHSVLELPSRGVRAIIAVPTRDLAIQVESVASLFGVPTMCLIGQRSMAAEKSSLVRSSIVVATIGRLIDHLVIGSLDLSFLEWLVVDEADRMLSKSDLDKWAIILRSVPRTVQRLLFSATMTDNPLKLNALKLMRPLFVKSTASSNTTTNKYIVVPNASMRVRCLLYLLEEFHETSKILIFCNSTENVVSLAALLARFGKPTSAFSGNMTGKSREKLVAKFVNGTVGCLVCTDVVTRGMDFPNVEIVINYDLPNYATTYIHRAGRTGRADKSGTVITICESKQMRHFRQKVIDISTCEKIRIDFSALIKHSQLDPHDKTD